VTIKCVSTSWGLSPDPPREADWGDWRSLRRGRRRLRWSPTLR